MARRAPLLLFAFALFVAPALAGCLGADTTGGALVSPGAASVLPEGVLVHGGDGLPVELPADVPAIVTVLRSLGVSAFEPTLGLTSDGAIFYATTPGRGIAAGYEAGVHRSRDGGLTWVDVSPRLPTGHSVPPETNDPYLYVDPATDRIFQFSMAPILVCAVLSWSDDGGASWTTNPRGCGSTPPWDHQTMVAAAPRASPTVGYPNVLHQCVNQIAASWCSRSLDGGFTWTPGTPAVMGADCGGLHGHLVAAPDGTVYLPKDHCGRSLVAISRDDGLTWENVLVSDEPTQGWSDPAMAIDTDGNVYYAYLDANGALRLTVSTDGGATWRAPVTASPPGVTAHIPAIAAGDAGRVVFAYPGTLDLEKGYASPEEAQSKALWHGFLAVSVDALSPSPTFQTTRVNPADDPLVRGACGPGRCPGMVDFIDVVVGPAGRPYASFVDACTEACVTDPEAVNAASIGLLATLADGPLLRAAPPADESAA